MKPKLKTMIIGAGGVTSYLLPALTRSFDTAGILVDGDILEEKNLDRQLFAKSQVGQHKAEALIKHLKLRKTWTAENKYLEQGALPAKEADIIFCCVDNHPARRAALYISETLECPIIIAANEYETSQAIYHDPKIFPDKILPQVRYPDIATSNEGSPIRCQGEALESTPQLAIANQVAAGLANLLCWRWLGTDGIGEDVQDFHPIEFQTTLGKLETITYGQANA